MKDKVLKILREAPRPYTMSELRLKFAINSKQSNDFLFAELAKLIASGDAEPIVDDFQIKYQAKVSDWRTHIWPDFNERDAK